MILLGLLLGLLLGMGAGSVSDNQNMMYIVNNQLNEKQMEFIRRNDDRIIAIDKDGLIHVFTITLELQCQKTDELRLQSN